MFTRNVSLWHLAVGALADQTKPGTREVRIVMSALVGCQRLIPGRSLLILYDAGLNTPMSRSRCPTVEPGAFEIWKWRFPWPIRIFSMSVENDFRQPHGNQGMRHFQRPACPPPTGDRLR